jgi:hypothetical protein
MSDFCLFFALSLMHDILSVFSTRTFQMTVNSSTTETFIPSKEALAQAQRLVNREQQYFGLGYLGENMEGSKMHQQLLVAYGKVWKHAH